MKMSLALLALTTAAATVPFLTIENEDEKEYYALTWHARRDKKSSNTGFCVDLFDLHRTVEGICRAKDAVTDALKHKKNRDDVPDAENVDENGDETEEVANVTEENTDTDATATEPEEA